MRRRLIGAGALLLVGVCGLFAAMVALQRAPGMPVGPQALLGRGAAAWRVLVFSVLVFWSALAPAVLACQIVRRRRWLWALPFGVAAAALACWGLLRLCAPPEAAASLLRIAWDHEALMPSLTVRFLLVGGSVLVGMVWAGGVVGAFASYGPARGGRLALGLTGVCAVLIALAALVIAAWRADPTLGEVPAAAVWARHAAALGLMMLVAGNAAAFAYACVQSRPRALLGVLLATVVLAGPML